MPDPAFPHARRSRGHRHDERRFGSRRDRRAEHRAEPGTERFREADPARVLVGDEPGAEGTVVAPGGAQFERRSLRAREPTFERSRSFAVPSADLRKAGLAAHAIGCAAGDAAARPEQCEQVGEERVPSCADGEF
ncbi:hypothetical protein BMH25_05420 [Leucobacter sp. OLCALW19]|nr:hypothetical protein BMH25_05420 [Leucobacter sp. OLCALW19]